MRMKMIVLVVFLMALLTSCAVNPNIQDTTAPQERSYVSADITYSEPTAQYAFRLNMDSTETELAKYFFESNIDDKEREACIEATEKVLSSQPLESAIPEIYIFSQDRYDDTLISNHKLYSSLQEWKSAEYIADVFGCIYEKP